MGGPESYLGPFVSMNDSMAAAYIVRDISSTLEAGEWRWAFGHPTLRFYLRSAANWKFAMSGNFPGDLFQKTGPVTLTIRINDQDFDKLRIDRPGDRQYEKPVPPQWLRARAENFVTLQTDKPWAPKPDATPLSFVLIRAGFVP